MTTLEKLEELIYHGFKETDRRSEETDRRILETDRLIKENARQLQSLKEKIAGLTDSLGRFAEHMVEPSVVRLFRGRKLYGAVAGMSVDANVARYAYKQGLFVLAPSGENMQILNDDEFKPRTFGGPDKKPRRKKR